MGGEERMRGEEERKRAVGDSGGTQGGGKK